MHLISDFKKQVGKIVCVLNILTPFHLFAAENVTELPKKSWNINAEISRSKSLYDHQDGTKSESIDGKLVPSYKTSFGSFSSIISYSQDLIDSEAVSNGLADTILAYSYLPKTLLKTTPIVLTGTPGISLVAPTSKVSQKQTQLNTAVSLSYKFNISADESIDPDYGLWNLMFSVSAGRNFHVYEEDINGAVLNKYSSNQNLNLSYSIKDISISIDYLHRSRWTYQGNVKDSYVISEELGYSFNENFGVAIGHSNEASGLKPNGYETDFNIIDENSSSVYLSINVSY